MWSARAEQIVSDLIASLPPERLDADAIRLIALPICCTIGGCYYLRPDGAFIAVGGDDNPCEDVILTDRASVIGAIVGGARRYPELKELIPAREPGATDCPCQQHPRVFGPGKVICGQCGGVGWLPPA